MSRRNTPVTRVTLSRIPELLPYELCARKPRSFLLQGSAGSGKTAFINTVVRQAWADANGVDVSKVKVICEVLAGRDGQEIMGPAVPAVDEDGNALLEWSVSPVIQAIDAAYAEGYEYIVLFFDEISKADQIGRQVIRGCTDDSRKIGKHSLQDNVYVCFATNRIQDNSGDEELEFHLMNTLTIWEVVPEVDQDGRETHASYLAHCRDTLKLPEVVLQFIERDGHDFFDWVPPSDGSQGCTYRSFTNAAMVMEVFINRHNTFKDFTPVRELIEGKIGKLAYEKFAKFIATMEDVPTASEIQRDPENATIPRATQTDRGTSMSVGLQMIAANVAANSATDSKSAGKALTYIMRMPSREVMITQGVAFQQRCASNGWWPNNSEAVEFMNKYSDIIFG